MTLDEQFDREECIQENKLRRLLDNKPVPIYYDGFEPLEACTSHRFDLLCSPPASKASRASSVEK